jgi:hypothetical protein
VEVKTCPTYWARIYMAGNLAEAERICRAHCYSVGLCVTLNPTEYIYSAGQESGFVVGLINYPRFPATPEEIDAKAEVLAGLLRVALSQRSFTIQTPNETRWFTQALPFELSTESASAPSDVHADNEVGKAK